MRPSLSTTICPCVAPSSSRPGGNWHQLGTLSYVYAPRPVRTQEVTALPSGGALAWSSPSCASTRATGDRASATSADVSRGRERCLVMAGLPPSGEWVVAAFYRTATPFRKSRRGVCMWDGGCPFLGETP